MTAGSASARFGLRDLGRFLEIQNLGLNLPFAIAFLLVASAGRPELATVALVAVAFVAARNAGHSFNRWLDRSLDAANPRTRDRALPSGRLTPASALLIAAASSGVVLLAAYLLNPLAFLLAPVALALVFGYSYTKRVTTFTTAYLGLVEAIVPAAVYIAVDGTLPAVALLAVAALLAWGTAFETIHSLGDLASDRALGLHSFAVRLGPVRSVRLVVALHAAAFALLVAYGVAARLGGPYDVGIAGMVALAAVTDRALARRPEEAKVPFERHVALSLFFLAGTAAAIYLPFAR